MSLSQISKFLFGLLIQGIGENYKYFVTQFSDIIL